MRAAVPAGRFPRTASAWGADQAPTGCRSQTGRPASGPRQHRPLTRGSCADAACRAGAHVDAWPRCSAGPEEDPGNALFRTGNLPCRRHHQGDGTKARLYSRTARPPYCRHRRSAPDAACNRERRRGSQRAPGLTWPIASLECGSESGTRGGQGTGPGYRQPSERRLIREKRFAPLLTVTSP